MGNPNRLLENINKVYPWVKCKLDSNVDADINFDPNNQPVFKDWLGNLRVFYAIDFGDHVSIIFENDVPEYYSIDEIHKIAISNLERDIEFKLGKLNFEGGYGILAGGDYEASSIMIKKIWNQIGNELQEDLIVGIPAKDLVFFAKASDLNAIFEIVNSIKEIFKSNENFLSKSLFIYKHKSKKWSLYKELNN
tara:strand:- start:946 stop:1524 length:579 start_codon:yes stop_codon:yes gene_type:complete